MTLENQVCSRELAIQLKEIEIPQESYFLWAKNNLIQTTSLMGMEKHELFEPHLCSAFTAVELLELLPPRIALATEEVFNNFQLNMFPFFAVDPDLIDQDTEILLSTVPVLKVWNITYLCDSVAGNDLFRRRLYNESCYDKNICNALAKALLILHKMGLITCQ
jgi:hypothetical protein